MNRIVIITGATSGYGLAAAKLFKKENDTVICVSRNENKVRETVEKYDFALGFAMDVTDYGKWRELYETVVEKFGRVDVLVNNAGGGVAIEDTVDLTKDKIDYTIALNLTSVIYGSKIFCELMKKQRDGIIINISSVCAKHCWAGWSVYAAAKAGVLNFTKGLYVELQPYGVRATTVIPAAASTGFQKSAGIPEENQTLKPEDIAKTILFAANQPKGAVVEEITVWGTSQQVQPL